MWKSPYPTPTLPRMSTVLKGRGHLYIIKVSKSMLTRDHILPFPNIQRYVENCFTCMNVPWLKRCQVKSWHTRGFTARKPCAERRVDAGKELIHRGRATVDFAPDFVDPLLVEYVNSSNLPILHESRQERLPPPDYNGKSRYHHRETVITPEITIRKPSLMAHWKDKISPYFLYNL